MTIGEGREPHEHRCGRGGSAGGAAAASPTSSPAIPDTTEMPAKSARAQPWNELFNLAKLISTTEIVPKPLRGRPDAIFAVMASAEERGIAPLTGLQNIDLIDGRPAPSAMLQRSMIQQAGHLLVWRRADRQAAVLYGRRRDNGSDFEATFTIDDAKAMKLTGKGNWATMPRAMLMARVTSLLGRMLFADVLLGMEYTPEELGAVGPYAAVDLDYDPDSDRHVMVDPETGEILDESDMGVSESVAEGEQYSPSATVPGEASGGPPAVDASPDIEDTPDE